MHYDLLFTSLLDIGLDQLSASIYLDLFEDPDLTITDLAKKYNVQRNKIYDSLGVLKQYDLVHKSEKFSRKLNINPPTRIIPQLQQKEFKLKNNLENLNNILPDLIKQKYHNKTEFIQVFKGKNQLLNLFDLILSECNSKQIYALGDFQTNIEFWGLKYEFGWRQRRIDKKIMLKSLTFKDQLTIEAFPKNKEELREIKFLPNKFKSEGLFVVSGNIVTQWNPIIPRAIYIDDPIFASMFKNIFELIWELV